MFPAERGRRLRRTPALRRLVAETSLAATDLVAPYFVAEGRDAEQPIPSMPGQVQHTVQSLVKAVGAARDVGVNAVLLFGLPAQKDARGTGAYARDGISQIALRALRDAYGDEVVLMADLCLDEYTDHGHCGVLARDGTVDNDATLELYGLTAVAQAEAGAAVVAPSGMMDGQVAAIRGALDATGHPDTVVLAYAVKYASALYGPFREAVDVTIAGGGNRRDYQMDPANAREAIREARADVAEGADILMVKPATPYLDILVTLRGLVDVPLCAYQVSGEYAMIKAAAERGWIDSDAIALETLTAIKRAGADFILTYFATEVAGTLAQ